jgi:large subunit ribosomal protein L2
MGKNLIQQARGKGSPRYRAPSFRYKGSAKHKSYEEATVSGKIIDFIHCQGHSCPLAQIEFDDGDFVLMIAPEGLKVGETVTIGKTGSINQGNTVELSQIPEGTQIFNIESVPGDGGKFVRSSGTFARVLSQTQGMINVMLPSKKKKAFNPKCRATIGVVAGGGRTDKPIAKAGKKHFMMKARNKLYPIVSGNAQNAVDHPFGNSRSLRKAKAKPAPHNAPPGRKVGMIRPRHTGRNK